MRLVFLRRQWMLPVLLVLALAAAAAGWRAADGPQPSGPPAASTATPAGMVEDRDTVVRDSFYIDCRLDREQSRGRQVEYLQAIISDPKAADEERREAQSQLLRITREIERETSMENILRARGFEDAAVLFQGQAVTVILPQRLNAEELSSVTMLVARGTGVMPEDVIIIDRVREEGADTAS